MDRKEIMVTSDKDFYYNSELLVNEYEASAIKEHGRSSSKIDLCKETVDESQNENDVTLETESDTEEGTENLKQINQHFVVDFQDLQTNFTMVAVCSKCYCPLTVYENEGAR